MRLRPFRRRLRAHLLWLPAVLLFSLGATTHDTTDTEALAKIQDVVDGLRTRLSIPADVTVTIVPTNRHLVSVEPSKDRRGAFVMSFEQGFLEGLHDDDLHGIVAHELGHVWIFTHHPFLQTERLANEVAMRVVSRETLAKVYDKVWERDGSKGDLAQFLGQ